MILISSSNNDYSTTKVIDWLLMFNKEFVVINEENPITSINISYDEINEMNVNFEVNNKQINLKEIKSYWFRKAPLFFIWQSKKNITDDPYFDKNIYEHLVKEELRTVDFFIAKQLSEKVFLGTYTESNANHLNTLNIALKSGLKIPETIITPSKVKLNDLIFSKKHSTSLCFCC